ncbi:MAG: mycothiol system anti-sigma-R factor [Pseudonocardiales bacterium]|nr:mycothiol system anti-sigma-R factor [Pseudonocardiales bacterium]
MSCGKPHETPCSEVLEQLYLFLDNECDDVCRSKLAQHLEECGPCLEEYGVEEKIKGLLARKCREAAPAGLRARLHTELRHVVIEQTTQVSVERGPQGTTVEVRSTRIQRRS